jgi:hypothetical protein
VALRRDVPMVQGCEHVPHVTHMLPWEMQFCAAQAFANESEPRGVTRGCHRMLPGTRAMHTSAMPCKCDALQVQGYAAGSCCPLGSTRAPRRLYMSLVRSGPIPRPVVAIMHTCNTRVKHRAATTAMINEHTADSRHGRAGLLPGGSQQLTHATDRDHAGWRQPQEHARANSDPRGDRTSAGTDGSDCAGWWRQRCAAGRYGARPYAHNVVVGVTG